MGTAVSASGYLAEAIGLPDTKGNIELSLYRINGDGTLTLVPGSVFTTPFSGITALEFDPSGNFLAVAATTGLQIYHLVPGGALQAVGGPVDATIAFDNLAWDSSGHLYATSNKQQSLYIYASNSGVLSTAPGSPHSASQAFSLVVVP